MSTTVFLLAVRLAAPILGFLLLYALSVLPLSRLQCQFAAVHAVALMSSGTFQFADF